MERWDVYIVNFVQGHTSNLQVMRNCTGGLPVRLLLRFQEVAGSNPSHGDIFWSGLVPRNPPVWLAIHL